MNKGCKTKVGDVINGLMVVSDPYKIDGDKNYRAMVKCIFCPKPPYEIVISEIHRHVFEGCGCKKNRSNSINWESFEEWCVKNQSDLLGLWDYDLNNKSPDEVSSCTADKYYFKCPCGKHESEQHSILQITRLKNRVKPICKACNSIAQKLIDKYGENALETYWDYEKNNEDPWKLAYGTKTEVWIKCPCGKHPSFFRRVIGLIIRDIGCPLCAQEADTSSYQKKTYDYIVNTYGYDVKRERECSIIATNPITNYQMPYDNDVTIGNAHLIIEVNGEQHYDKDNDLIKRAAKSYNISVDEAFQSQQYRDELKKQYALDNGYFYIAIPYWAFRDDTYKTIIDETVHKISQDNSSTKLFLSREGVGINA